MTDLTVSFVLFNTPPAEVHQVVDQVREARLDVAIAIVDNSPEPVALEFGADPRVTVVRPDSNLGYGRGHNLALSRLPDDARYHLILNTDLLFRGAVLDELVAFMDGHPDVGLSMPRIVFPDGTIQPLCRRLPDPLDMAARTVLRRTHWARRRDARYGGEGWSYAEAAEFPFLSGCFMLCRRSVLDRVGGFDPRFFLYFEDTDLSRRMNALSKTVFVPVGPVVHEYRSRGTRNWRTARHKLVNAVRYFNKWGWLVDRARTRANAGAMRPFTDRRR